MCRSACCACFTSKENAPGYRRTRKLAIPYTSLTLNIGDLSMATKGTSVPFIYGHTDSTQDSAAPRTKNSKLFFSRQQEQRKSAKRCVYGMVVSTKSFLKSHYFRCENSPSCLPVGENRPGKSSQGVCYLASYTVYTWVHPCMCNCCMCTHIICMCCMCLHACMRMCSMTLCCT